MLGLELDVLGLELDVLGWELDSHPASTLFYLPLGQEYNSCTSTEANSDAFHFSF